ncbi:MAG: hypothetical protein HKN80_11225 [Acidimicrobiia bacterium]|nr:hypothetical protein [Acidimicrobiia bacterium]
MKSTAVYVVAWLWPPVLASLNVAAALVGAEDGWPVLGPAVVTAVGMGGLIAIGWLRQRPIAPGDDETYRSTALSRLAIVEAIGLFGVILAIAVGPWWIALIGSTASLVGLALSWPSASDQERHELLYLV